MKGMGHPLPRFTLASTLRRELVRSPIFNCEDWVQRHWCLQGDTGGQGRPSVQACLPSWLSDFLVRFRLEIPL